MEPTKNTNNISSSNNESLDPVFRGMPKPGQPITSIPRVNATVPPPIATPPANLPTSNSFSSQAATSASQFSAHAPSALDRLMNPNIDSQIPPASAPRQGVSQPSASQPSMSQSQPLSPSTSAFKPYTPPVVNVASPTQYPPIQSAPSLSSMLDKTVSQSSSSYSKGIPPAPSANITAAKLGNEVHTLLTNQQPESKKHKGTLALIIGAVVVLLLLAGGGYYWYTYMYLPNKDNTTESAQSTLDTSSNDNVTGTQSAFPTTVTKPVVNTSVKTPVPTTSKPSTSVQSVTPKPVTQQRVTRVTTPFTQAQRERVSSYIVANINSIGPKTNGTYEVTDVTFDGPDRAIVLYTNGRNSYSAIAVASIDTANNVRMLSFSPLEK